MSTRVHLGRQAEQHQFRPSAELPLTGRQITTHPVRNARAKDNMQTPMAFQFGMNNGLYMLRSAVVRMPIDAKFTTFSQKDMTREQVASIGLRNRPVKAFSKVTTYVNGLVSTRLPEQCEWVEEHIEQDSAYGMDYPNDGEMLPVVCPRGYTGGKLENRANSQALDTSALDSSAYEFTVESTSNVNFQQRAHVFRDGFNTATQTWSGDIIFPVRCGPFQPYQSSKSIGNSIIPYVGEATVEYNFRQYQSKDSNSDVYKFNGGGAYIRDVTDHQIYYIDQQASDKRVPINQPRHMDVAKYLFEAGGTLAQSARSSGSFGARTSTEPFCFCVALRGGAEGSFLIQPYDQRDVCNWYNGENQAALTLNRTVDNHNVSHTDNFHNEGFKSTKDLKTGFNALNFGEKFQEGTLLNFDQQWLKEHTELPAESYPFECVVGSVSQDACRYAEGEDPVSIGNMNFRNTGMYTCNNDTHADPGVNATAIAALPSGHTVDGEATVDFDGGAINFKLRALRIGVEANVSHSAINEYNVAGKTYQLANALGLPSRQVFFEPNTLVCPKFSAGANVKSPLVTYVVWEVYDDKYLEATARDFSLGAFEARQLGGTAYETADQRKIQELEYVLSRKNYKNGQVLGAWLPSKVMYLALSNYDRVDLANQAIAAAPAYGEASLLNQGDRPLYNPQERDAEDHYAAAGVRPIATTYTGAPFTHDIRRDAWQHNNVTAVDGNTGPEMRALIMKELIFNMSRFIDEELNLITINGNGTWASFLLRQNTGAALGYDTLRWIIPRGTRIRLKTFRHIGISATPQLIGTSEDTGAQNYNPPQVLANGVDFDWSERRGRFPYQRIVARGDNYVEQSSKQGSRGFQYEDAVKNIQLSWRQQPELICEWIILPRGKVQPQYRLAYPQFEFFTTQYPTDKFTLPERGAPIELAIRGLKLNEVPNQVYVYAMLTEESRNYLEWLDVKPTITSLETQINETVDTTSHIPLWLGYRFFKECCPFSTKTLDEWTQDNMWVLQPSQLNISPETWTESMARVSTLSIKATVKMNRAYRQIESNYSPALFPGLPETGRSVMKPEFELRVVIVYNNHSLIMNSRNEMLIEKNTLSTRGPTGLVKQDRGLPKQGGLPFY